MDIGCPICNKKALPLSSGIRTYIRPFNEIVSTLFGECGACDFAFAINPLSQEQLNYYYQNNDQFRRSDLTKEEISHIGEQADFCSRVPFKRVLEIGADNGAFLLALKSRGASAYFDELNPSAVSLMQKQGIEMGSGTFDLIALRHVFEHIPNPVDFIKTLKERLNPSGHIFLEVPDYSADLKESDIFQFEHVNYFSITSIQAIAKKSGYAIEACEFTKTTGYSTTPNRVMRVLLSPVDRRSDFQNLLNDSNAIYNRIKSKLTGKVALYGAGTITLGYIAYGGPIYKIYDADPKKIGTDLLGHTILDPQTITPNDFESILLTVVGYEKEVRHFLTNKGITNIIGITDES